MSTVQVSPSSMTVLEQERPPVFEILGQEPPQRRSWLAGALVVAVLVIAGLGGWLYADHQRSGGELAAATTVTAWLNAFNAHDAATLWSMSSRAWTWESAGGVNGQNGPYTGTELLGVISSDWKVAAGSAIQRRGEPVVMSDTQVAVPVRVIHLSGVAGASPVSNGVILCNLTTDDGELKVAEVIWLSSR
jgi:hypothetical protein